MGIFFSIKLKLKHLFSSTFQLIITILGFIGAGLMILESFNDWDESPLLTTIQSIDAPITDLLFPTVTVCQGIERPKS
jgi:hypothetical protein